jgi:hypothetical protein
MVARAAGQLIGTLGLIIAFGLVPGTASSQAQSRPDEKERIAEEILAAEKEGGPRSPALIQLLTELAVLYEADGQYVLATAALEQARALVRANYGLNTLDQVPLLQQALANEQAIGNFPMVRAIEEELLELARRNPRDLRSVAIHRDAGVRSAAVLQRYLAGEAPPEVYAEAGFFWFSRNYMIRDLAATTQVHYADAAAVILRNRLYASEQLRDLETEILRAADVVRERVPPEVRSRSTIISKTGTLTGALEGDTEFPIASGSRRYRSEDRALFNPALAERMNMLTDLASGGRLRDAPVALQNAIEAPHRGVMTTPLQIGRDSYSRVIAYDEAAFGDSADEATLRNRLQAYIESADWDLLYSENGAALDQYERVHALLKTARGGERLIEELFAPPIPRVLPAFQPNPLETSESARYIDVTFEVTRFGESRRVEIAGATPDVSNAEKDDLVSLVRGAQFRPRVTDGELGRPATVVVRYYLD